MTNCQELFFVIYKECYYFKCFFKAFNISSASASFESSTFIDSIISLCSPTPTAFLIYTLQLNLCFAISPSKCCLISSYISLYLLHRDKVQKSFLVEKTSSFSSFPNLLVHSLYYLLLILSSEFLLAVILKLLQYLCLLFPWLLLQLSLIHI